MKTKVLFLAGCVALATVARGQNETTPAAPVAPINAAPTTPSDAAPINSVPAAQADPAPAAPTNAVPAVPTNAPAAEVKPVVDAATNATPANVAPVAGVTADARLGTTNELVPLIVIDDVPLIDAVKNLARQAGLNYLPDPKLATVTNQPNVTMRLENVTAHDALRAVLETYGLQIIQDPNIKVARITVKDPKAAEPLLTKIIQLKNIQPTNVVDILKKTFVDPRSQVMGDPRTSQLIIVTTEKEFPAIEEAILRLDTPSRQVLIEAQLWETAKNPKSVKGIDWGGTFENQKVSWGNGRITSGETTTTRPGDLITRTTPTGTTSTRRRSSTTESTTYSPLGGGLTFDSVKGFHPATAFLSADGLSAVISFFNTDTDTEIVATPRAVTLDNQQAILSVTRAFPIFKITPGSANSPAGSEVTYTNLGTILQVTPHIAANSNISLSVIPEVSDVAAVDRQIVNGFENTANVYAIRRMETHVMIPSSFTLVLGGLISDRTSHAMNKVPILGDTPFFGALFRKDSKERDKANLIVFITPTIVGDYDYQASSTDFLQTKMANRPEPKESFMDSAKPWDWTKPKQDPAADEGKPLAAPTRPDATTDPIK